MTQPAGDGQPQYQYTGQYRPEVQADPEPIGLSNWDGSLTARAAREPAPIPHPTSGKNLAFYTPRKYDAHRQRTGPFVCWGDIQSGPAFGTFNPVSLQVRSSSQSPIDPSDSRMCTPPTSPVFTRPGLGWIRPGGSSPMAHITLLGLNM